MGILIQSPEESFNRSIQEITHLYPTLEGCNIQVKWHSAGNNLTVAVDSIYHGIQECFVLEEQPVPAIFSYHNQLRLLARKAVLLSLARLSVSPLPPWGILTGVRPSKVAHKLLDAGWEPEKAKACLVDMYALHPDKAGLLVEVALRQRPFLSQSSKQVGIYIGIPFCPTRCAYCSFPAHPVPRNKKLVEQYLQALFFEIREAAKLLREHDVTAHTLYIGGGTPTVLEAAELEGLFREAYNLPLAPDSEITCEAGRPDTITQRKMEVLKEAGVTRVSINPQSMQEKTLRAIGRCHCIEDVYMAVEIVRRIGFPVLNMDLIAGLPGETPADWDKTLCAVLDIMPQNITVHTLALKRASQIRQQKENFNLPASETVEQMLELAGKTLRKHEYMPYYLYRQKDVVEENIGYARNGAFCRYNINIIEERESLIGLGAGGGTKIVHLVEDYIENIYNPKDPRNYIERIEELVERKKALQSI